MPQVALPVVDASCGGGEGINHEIWAGKEVNGHCKGSFTLKIRGKSAGFYMAINPRLLLRILSVNIP